MKVGIIGGGINGLASAWVLAKSGHEVVVYERDSIMQATSRSSSKLLHGGLRYLENHEFRLVRESVKERDNWLIRAPHLTQPIEIVLPIYSNSRRNRLTIKAGLWLYTHIAGHTALPRPRWYSPRELLLRDPGLRSAGLKGGYSYFDGAMDDYKLGCWVAEQARTSGAVIQEHSPVERITPIGEVHTSMGGESFDRVVNIAGPWAMQLIEQSGLHIPYELDLVRGSHLVIDAPCPQAYILEVPEERRIVFHLPWMGKTLFGTTEVRQDINQTIVCSDAERQYLLDLYHYYWPGQAVSIERSFAGVRPLVKHKQTASDDPARSSREYAIHRDGKLIHVLGGKWTTCLALAHKVEERLG